MNHAAQLAIIKQVSRQESHGSAGRSQSDEQAGITHSAGNNQAAEQAGITRLSWQMSSRLASRYYAAELAIFKQMSRQESSNSAGNYKQMISWESRSSAGSYQGAEQTGKTQISRS